MLINRYVLSCLVCTASFMWAEEKPDLMFFIQGLENKVTDLVQDIEEMKTEVQGHPLQTVLLPEMEQMHDTMDSVQTLLDKVRTVLQEENKKATK